MDNIDKLLFSFYKLYRRLHNHRGEEGQKDSLLTKWNYFATHTDTNCTYAQKSRNLFLKDDLPEIRILLNEIVSQLDALEKGEDISER